MNEHASHPDRTRVILTIAVVLIAASFLTAVASPSLGARAEAGPRKRGCADLQIDFFPNRVSPGQGMDMDYALTNCSSVKETLVVPLHSKGPCPFVPSSLDRYTLGPREGFGASGLFMAPECHGHYKVKAQVLYRGRVLDHAVAGFTVLPSR
jgi:hypothetical protein